MVYKGGENFFFWQSVLHLKQIIYGNRWENEGLNNICHGIVTEAYCT
jgi:hypothetical protein